MNTDSAAISSDKAKPKGRILLVFADGRLRRELLDIARSMAGMVQAVFSVRDARLLCLDEPFDVMLLVGDAAQLDEAKSIPALGGWAAAMPILAVCSGSLNLAEARAAGVSMLIPDTGEVATIWSALTGAMAADARSPTWWVD